VKHTLNDPVVLAFLFYSYPDSSAQMPITKTASPELQISAVVSRLALVTDQGAYWHLDSPDPPPYCCSLSLVPKGGPGYALFREWIKFFWLADKNCNASYPLKCFGSHGSGIQILSFHFPSEFFS